MKFFIFMCCMACLLTGISSRLRRTTPMSPGLRSDDAEERQVAKFAEMIDFVNSVDNNDDRRSYFRRHGRSKRQNSRRLNEVMAAMYGFAELKEIEDFGDLMRDIEEKIRHDVTEDPDVLMEHGVRQKNNNKEEILDKKDTSFDASKYSTAKLKDVETTLEVTGDNPNHDNATVRVKAQDDVQELTTDETINRRSFIDVKDDDKPITGRKILTNHEKQNSKPKAKKEHHDASPAIKTDKFEKKTQNNKSSRKKDKAQLDKKKADKHNNSKETVTKKENNKENGSSYFIYSQEKLKNDSIHPKYEPDDKINNQKNGDTNENSGKDNDQKDKTWDKNENNLTSAERLTLKVDNRTHNDRHHMEQYSIYSHKEKSENSNKHSIKSHEKIDEYDKKMKDKYHDIRGKRKSQWIKVDTQNDKKESLRDRNKDNWSQKESDLDKSNDEWISKEGRIQNDDRLIKNKKNWDNDDPRNKKEKYWDKNDEKSSEKQKDWENDDRSNKKEKDWDNDDKRNKKEKYWGNNDARSSKKEKPRDNDDERGTIKEKYWNNKKSTDKDFDKMEYEWNKRHEEYDKYENDAQLDDNDHARNEKNFKETYNDHKKRDSDFNKKDDWSKRSSEENNNRDRAYDWNESGNKNSYGRVVQEGVVRHDRYRVVDRVDSGNSRNEDY